jgi:hypothetical protein
MLLLAAQIGAAEAAPAPAVLPDACGLLSREEVQAAFGLALAPGAKSTDGSDACDYLSAEGPATGVSIELRPGGASAFDQLQAVNRERRLPTTEIVGLGDRAMSVTLPQEPGTAVYVVHGELLIAVFVSAKDPSKNFSIAVALARRVLSRL